MQDDELVGRIQSGDDRAVAELHGRYVDAVFRYLLTQTSSYHDAEELLQDVFFRAASKIHSFRGEASVKTWLFSIAKNAVKDYYRRRAKHDMVKTMEEKDLEQSSFSKDNAEKQMMRHIHMNELEQCMKELPLEYRQVLHLRFLEDMSIKETSQVLEKSQLSVKALQWRARKKLKECMGMEVFAE
ncbi:RNA polymerase sigma factor [Alkalicoccus urumqiensis]|uniref:RNA polymerase sigma factor n=1 Tax=Alkalicoccus urumqiensis TaxID=1548213 RepID=A0A2P6MJ88_ALKUR|nr:RNA polymerase sigma factor [Alkalicoccus urumqiensis]PRO66323.1 RNA polymerase sigma factor [Alkalicoccus urumqiensis]